MKLAQAQSIVQREYFLECSEVQCSSGINNAEPHEVHTPALLSLAT